MTARIAVGYIRGRFIRGKRTPDWEMQRNILTEYADICGYKLIKMFGESQIAKKGIKIDMPKLLDALTLCKKRKGIFLYCDLGNYRKSPVLFAFIRNNNPTKTGFVMKAVKDADILTELERLARYDKCVRPNGKPIKRRSVMEKRAMASIGDPCLAWRESSNISMKRYKNYIHLWKGPDPIYKLINSSSHLTDRDIAEVLHDRYHVTVDGKIWKKENVRRTRAIIDSSEFAEFCNRKDAARAAAI